MKNPKKLSTAPYKGVRDFYPEDLYIQKYIFKTMRTVAEKYGYVEYDASILEPTELYEAKTGDEIVTEQTYSFVDRGDRKVTLRPEMTPTVARLVAARKRELAFPLRWYSIPNVFRYERPQKGRLREHSQLNVDIFGVDSIEADVEVMEIAYMILKEYGLKDNQFEIRINDRKTVNSFLKKSGLDETRSTELQKLLDRKSKMSDEDYQAQKEEIAGSGFKYNPEESEDIRETLAQLKSKGINNARFDPELMRGFDYYTGIVFEVYDKSDENNRSLFGGGRYDDLLDIFGQEKIPAVGFGMGDVTMRDVLETYDLLPDYKSTTDLYICILAPEYIGPAQQIAQKFRGGEINVEVDMSGKKVGTQIGLASKKGARFIVCIGEQEIKNNEYALKELSSGKEELVQESTLAKAVELIKANR